MPTYNHAPYLAHAIESVLAQKTDFEVELVIGDDCSTDGTGEIARRYTRAYPARIRLFEQKRNVGIWENDQSVTRACRGEYIAWLDGDDYWCCENKLQRQVDLLDRHPGMAACFHRAGSVSQVPPPVTWRGGPEDAKPAYTLDDFLERGHFVASCSVVFRSALTRPPMEWARETPFLEVAQLVRCAAAGPIGFIDETMAMFRYHGGGVYGNRTRADHFRAALHGHLLIGRHMGFESRPSYKTGLERLSRQLAEALAATAADAPISAAGAPAHRNGSAR